jgi:small-conductance mechanosensitive channel
MIAQMTRLGLTARALSACLLLALATPSFAQEEAGGAAPTPPPEPEVIAVGQIAAQAEVLEARLREIEEERSPEDRERVEAQVESIEERRTVAEERLEGMLARRHAPGELEALAASWTKLDRELEDLQSRVGDRADLLDARVAEIAELTELWKRTRTEARGGGAPQAVLRQIGQALEMLAAAKRQLGSRLDEVLEVQNRVQEVRRALRPDLERVDTARTELAAGLFERQDEPVWGSLSELAAIPAVPGEVATNLVAILDELGGYARQHLDRIVVQVLLFLLLGWSFSRARAGRARRHPGGEPPAYDALRHPWPAAFLVAMLLTPFLQPSRVRGYPLVLTPFALAAWYRVLTGMLSPALRLPLLALALLALVEVVRGVVAEVHVLDRLLLLGELAGGLVGVVWLLRPARLQHVPWREASGPWLRFVGGWLRLAGIALAVGVIATLLGYTSLADRIAVLTIWGSVVGTAWVALVRLAEAVAEHLVEEGHLDRIRMIRANRTPFVRLLNRALRGLGVFAWAYVTLTAAGLWSPARSAFGSLLSGSVGYGPVSVSLGGVLAFGLTLWLSWLLARFVSFALDHEVFARVRMPPGVPFALSTFTRYAILVVGFVIAMGTIGFSLDRVTLLLSAVGVGIGFGLQNVVNNFVSGAILLFERPIRVGDRVQIDDLFGIVSTIGLRASKVRTFDGSDVIVPNGDLISAKLVNWTLADRKRRVILPVGVAYGTRPQRVIELLLEVARAHSEVVDEPAPTALFRGFGDSSLNFEIRAFTEGDWLEVLSDLALATSAAFEQAGITIPFPQRDLHLRNIPELRDALAEVTRSRPGGSDGSTS